MPLEKEPIADDDFNVATRRDDSFSRGVIKSFGLFAGDSQVCCLLQNCFGDRMLGP